ncbi:MAG TPA: hypothetical protein VF411_02110 [Bacteroidia bacterium]
MKQLVILALFAVSSLAIRAQSKAIKSSSKIYIDTLTGFQLTYADSIAPFIVKSNENIKAQMEPFVIEFYKETLKKKMDTIPDACYQFNQVYKNKYKLGFKEYSCTEGAAGSLYYTFLYTLKKEHYTILLKFIHRHVDVYTEKTGKPIPFNKKKDIRWVADIMESARFIK